MQNIGVQMRKRKIIYPYVNIRVEDEYALERIGVNLKKLYKYIDKNKNVGCTHEDGNAYRCIKKKANESLSRNDRKISKRQVVNLARFKTRRLSGIEYIQIPYMQSHIFKAIFEIVDELRRTYPLPNDLILFVGKMRRDIFYNEQWELYKEWYTENKSYASTKLYDQMDSSNAVLRQNF